METQRVILITGSSTGFGRLMVEGLARKGYMVFASMRDIAGRNRAVVEELHTMASIEGLSLQVVELDVADDDSAESATRTAIDHAGRIDVLVNNVGNAMMGPNEGFTLEQVRRLFDTNFFGAVRMNRAVLPYMRRQGSGLLVHITSVGGRWVAPLGGIYSASKFALEALAESYRYDLSGLGIDSIIVEPGGFPTPTYDKLIQPEDLAKVAEYGQIGEIPARMLSGLRKAFSGPHAPNPQEVADAVERLIATPAGSRPLRTLVGEGVQFMAVANQAVAQAQSDFMDRLGYGGLMVLRSRDAADR